MDSSANSAELRSDVAVIGAGVGGVAAALAALRRGLSVVLTEETDWIGGQLTSQAVPPDEHPWIEQFGCTAGYPRVPGTGPRLLPALVSAHLNSTPSPRPQPGCGLCEQAGP